MKFLYIESLQNYFSIDSPNDTDAHFPSSKYSELQLSIYDLSAVNVSFLVPVMKIMCY